MEALLSGVPPVYCINYADVNNFKEIFLIFIPKGWTRSMMTGNDDAWNWFLKSFNSIAKYLEPYKEKAKRRCDKGEYWWELRACDYYKEFEKPKIVYPDIAKESRFSFDEEKIHFGNTVYFISLNDKYLLGILNSRLIFSYFKRMASVLGDADKAGRIRWFSQDVIKIPIRVISLNNPNDIRNQNKMVNLVNVMLDLHKHIKDIHSDTQKSILQRQIEATDREIDQLVYELYGLTDEDIKIVEGETS